MADKSPAGRIYGGIIIIGGAVGADYPGKQVAEEGEEVDVEGGQHGLGGDLQAAVVLLIITLFGCAVLMSPLLYFSVHLLPPLQQPVKALAIALALSLSHGLVTALACAAQLPRQPEKAFLHPRLPKNVVHFDIPLARICCLPESACGKASWHSICMWTISLASISSPVFSGIG